MLALLGVPRGARHPPTLRWAVGSPADALNTFRRSGMDVLVLENVLVVKD